MFLPLPRLDDRRWDDLVEEARALIPLHAPEWTDHNVSDPGITVAELSAWIAEQEMFQLDQVPARHRRKFLALLGIVARSPVPARTVLHCFTGGPQEARRGLDAGMYLSFSGIVTFKTADDVRQAAQLCPLDRLLVETDSPYLTPVPHRGQPNRPAWVALVGQAVAETKRLAVDYVADASWANAERLYRLGSPA